MPTDTKTAGDYTSTVKAGAETSGSIASASSGVFRKPSGNAVISTPGRARGSSSLLTNGAISRNLGLPVALRTPIPASIPAVVPIPLRIASLRGWYDAADASTLVLSGSQVNTWKDKSGRANDLTGIANTSTKPVYTASPTPFIVTTNAGFEGPANSDFTSQSLTFFCVMRQFTGNGGPIVTFRTSESESGWWMWGGDNPSQLWLEYSTNGWTPYPKSSTFPAVNNDLVLAAQWNGVGNPIYLRWRGATNVTDTQANTLPRERLRLGFRRSDVSNHARYYEVLYFNSALTSTEVQLIEGYLAWKWGLQATLANGHLYQVIQPT